MNVKDKDIRTREIIKEIICEAQLLNSLLRGREVYLVSEKSGTEERCRIKRDYIMTKNMISGSARRFT